MSAIFDYRVFQENVEDKRRQSATFYRADLHVHTIGSPASDYPSIHDKSDFVKDIPKDEKGLRDDPETFKLRFIETAKERNLSIVAITDHNEADMAEALSKLSDDELMILPGIEISVQTGLFPDSTVHIVGIFPKGTSSRNIDKVFPVDCGMPQYGQRDISSKTQSSIEELIGLIKSSDLRGICIAAHVDSEKGMRTLFRMQDREWLKARCMHRLLKKKEREEGLTTSEKTQLEQLERQLSELPDDMQNKYLRFLANHDFDAVQIQNYEAQEHYGGEHTEALDLPPFVCIVASDAHTLADIGCEGHCIHIKLAELNLNGIKKAFKDPEARIRYDSTVPHNRVSRILGISFEGGVFDGEIIGFSDNLTTLIGGRGTGKSAIIEAVRYVFQQPIDDLAERLKTDILERKEYTLSDTIVRVLFKDSDNQTLVLKRRLGERRTAVFDLDGQPLSAIELPGSRTVRAEIYGWSEIETLSDSPRKQLSLLDRYIPESETLRFSIEQEKANLRSNGEQLTGLALDIQNLLPLVADAAEVERELQKFRKPELDTAFQQYDTNREASLGLAQVLKALAELESSMPISVTEYDEESEETGNTTKFSGGITEALDDNAGSLVMYDWWQETKTSLQKSCDTANRLYEELLEILSEMRLTIESAQEHLDTERAQIEATLNALAEKSGEKDFQSAVARRQELSQRSLEIKGHQKDIDAKCEDFESLLKQRRNQIIPSLQEAREKMFEARKAKAQSIAGKLGELEASSKVQIEILPLQDCMEFTHSLGRRDGTSTSGMFKGIDRQYLSKDYAGYYSRRFTPHEFVSFFLDDSTDKQALAIRYVRVSTGADKGKIVRLVEGEIIEEDDFIVEIKEEQEVDKWDVDTHEFVLVEDVEKIWNHLSPWFYDNEVQTYPDPEKLENLLALEHCEIEDKPLITLDEKPIAGLSPGQRCSALIPIVLVEGEAPLIIDQPEDNLDNELVFELVVDILRRLKERRQVIVATHNPNIPVSGDAEQVIVLKSPSKRKCLVAEYGSIDDDRVIENIKTIMEGGDKAFDMRVKKYGIRQ
jgi:DNA repair ATPase RecN